MDEVFQLRKPHERVTHTDFTREKDGTFVPFDGVTGMAADNYTIKIYKKLGTNRPKPGGHQYSRD